MKKITLLEMKEKTEILPEYHSRIVQEWERVSGLGFGNPQICINDFSSEKVTSITCILSFQGNTSIFCFYENHELQLSPSIHVVYLTTDEVRTMFEMSLIS